MILRGSAALRLQTLALIPGVAAILLGLLASPLPGADDRAIGSQHPLNRSTGVAVYGGEALSYEVIDGMAIHDGDMVLGTVEEVIEATRNWRSRNPATGSLPERRDLSPEGGDSLWPDGTVPYEIEEGFTARALQDIEAAIHEWNSRTVITLVERTTESSFVQFRPRSSTPSSLRCSAVVGTASGARGVWLRSPRGCGVRATVHEIGHSVGLRHEHQRKDRDNHVRVLDLARNGPNRYSYTNIRPVGWQYDFASVMHYSGGIESIPPGIPFRSSRWLSTGDIDGVARMYGMPPTATTISTNPPGLEIIVDGESLVTPASFDWADGSEHVLEVPSPQTVGSERYVFGRWNDQGDSKRTIASDPDVTWYEANFVVQKQFITCVDPADAGAVTTRPESSDGFYTVSAPIEFEAAAKPDSTLQFAGWDWNNSTTRHGDFKNPASVASVSRFSSWTSYQANFKAGPFFVIDTDMDRARIQVDGRSQNLPYAVQAAEHQEGIRVNAPETMQVGSGVRYRFKGWSDGGERSHTANVPSAGGSLQLDLAREYLIFGRPIGRSDRDAALQVLPDSEDGYYEEGTQVTMTAVPTTDRHFAGWIGDVSSPELVQTVQADAPKSLWPVFAVSQPLPPGGSAEVALAATDQLELHNGSDGYNVLVPSDAAELTVTFQSTTPAAEVDLYMALGREVAEQSDVNGEMESIIADYESKTPGATESITINRSSVPPLIDEVYTIGLAVHPTQTAIQGTLSVEIRRSGITGASPGALTYIGSTTTDPARQTIRLSHELTGSVRYRIDSSLASVTVSPQEWVQTETGVTDIIVSVNSAGQEVGSHQGTLTVVQLSEDETVPTGIEIPVLVGIIETDSSGAAVPEIRRVALTSRPNSGGTYALSDQIEVTVYFAEPIEITGTPRLALTVGDQTRQADGVGSATDQCGGYGRILFRYEVQAADMDTDGVGIPADALTLNGGTIRSPAGTDANLGLGSHAIVTARGHEVDGSLVVPRVAGMEIWGGPQSGTSYGAGEWIWVWVDMDAEVEVDGDPQLALSIGTQTRQASFHGGGPITLWFRYAVQAGDLDADGIRIFDGALALNGGTIRSLDGTNANLDLGEHAIASASGHPVDGSTPATLVVRGLEIHTRPLNGVAYGRGEEIGVYVAFTGPIEASGAVQLVLNVGGYNNRASYTAYQPSALWFSYRVQSSDNDPDGISIPADGLLLNGGGISSPAGATVDRSLGQHAITNAAEHKVRGGG